MFFDTYFFCSEATQKNKKMFIWVNYLQESFWAYQNKNMEDNDFQKWLTFEIEAFKTLKMQYLNMQKSEIWEHW